MPDKELFHLAVRGKLRHPGVLEGQVRRMLHDDKASSLATSFASQWLQTRGLVEFRADPNRFPTFDESLRFAMLQETEHFVMAIIREDRSVLGFLDADFTFVNERLARHYGMAGVIGPAFRRVSLAGTPRAGILTQASVLTATSNPTRTSPVKRGKWILENLLGRLRRTHLPTWRICRMARIKSSGAYANAWSTTELNRLAPAAMPAWIRSAWPWKTSTPWAPGAFRRTAKPLMLRALFHTGKPSTVRPNYGPSCVPDASRSPAVWRKNHLFTHWVGASNQPIAVSLITSCEGRPSPIIGFLPLVLAIVQSEPFQNRSVIRGEP